MVNQLKNKFRFSPTITIFLAMTAILIAPERHSAALSSQNSGKPSISQCRTHNNARLRVAGSHIVDSNGKPVRLRGIYTRSEWLGSEQEVKWFKQWGVNFVRILLSYDHDYWQAVNNGKVDINKRGILREPNLCHMDTRVQWLETHQIYFMIEVHWRALGADDNLVKPQLLAEQFSETYRTVAQRYKKLNYFVGLCMFSEIYVAPQYYKDYKKICTAIVDAVHSVNPELIVSVTGVQTSAPDSLIDQIRIDRPAVIYDFHFYSPKIFTHYRQSHGDLRYPGWIANGWFKGVELVDINYLADKLQPALDFSTKWKVPLWCGEFGAFNNAPDNSSQRWVRDVVELFEKNNIPWILWTWHPGQTDVPQYFKELWRSGASRRRTTIVPHGGPFTKSMSVKLYTNLNDADIYYTLEGNEPDFESNLYKQPFTVNGDQITVKARAFNSAVGWTEVDVASFYGVPPRKPDNPKKVLPGLRYSYFEPRPDQVNNFENLDPVRSGIVRDFDRGVADGDNNIAIKFSGFIDIPADGMYYFYTSDAGISSVLIGKKTVVDNQESRWINRRTGFIPLKAGKHEITVTYCRADKDEVYYSNDRKDEWFMVEYEGPGIEKQKIPASVLYHSPQIED
jgi:hypothetical protein